MSRTGSRLHVLMVLESHYPAQGGGGAESQVRTLARGLRQQGHRVTVLTPLHRLGPQTRVSRVDGVPVCRLRFPRMRLLGAPVLWLRLLAFLWRRRRRYDAWHAHIAHHLAAICCLLGRRLGIPVLVKVAGNWEFRHALADRRDLVSKLAFFGLSRAYRWQAISQRIAGELASHGVPRERVLVVPNAVDAQRWASVEPSPSQATRLLFLGRLNKVKGLDLLLEAFAKVLPDFPDSRLRLVGTGGQEQALRAQVKRLGLEGHVQFEGHRSDLHAVLADADIAVLPSHLEGLSNTLLECMASGLPMLVTRISGSEDLVRHGHNGWMCEPGDLDGLTHCLREALACPVPRRREMGQRARQTVLDYASLPRVVERLVAAYRGHPQAAVTASGALRATGEG